ncbi:MAG: histidine--tRNA ligase [Candidatus Omnitrophica bacterium]|nr:histidine--tRNA ligase [Candidatus Omnitrophota bacterium]
MKYKAVRGMQDILPQDVGIWHWLERKARSDLESYGFKEIRTPLLEDTSVFVRSIGETTDIVKKEMYTFKDKKERSLTLRPEGTAPIVRSYIEHSLDKAQYGSKLYYIGPMFRSERPQKGRTRQFHQIGIEVFGSKSPYADVEVIMQLRNMLNSFELEDFTINLNSLGCNEVCKPKFTDKLQKYLEGKESRLCEDCKRRVKINVLRVLDCKKDSCIQVVRNAPSTLDGLCDPCKDHFDRVKEGLSKLKLINIKETKNLVRGLDYYTGTVFEVTHPDLGAQDAIGAGGRYDNLVKDMGGPDTPAIGYALGMERIILALRNKTTSTDTKSEGVVYIATLGDMGKIEGLKLADEIRKALPSVVLLTSTMESSLKSQLRAADRQGAKLVLILGEDEIEKGEVLLKDMIKKDQVPVKRKDIVEELKKRLKC